MTRIVHNIIEITSTSLLIINHLNPRLTFIRLGLSFDVTLLIHSLFFNEKNNRKNDTIKMEQFEVIWMSV